ncbi:hypothetical protein NADFUDRAFT_49525 [Nadsonia fulvescens var. elongata DSM 6958]|uniref:Protein BIG1 n=1 Tax=Nadsonia fulvescens var. elongata DSM 6958 TaxID=857566 RepID=A0A1E3PNT9_9ASCO|nr:hypothetical protein NADFUDRAFT_49525 [Nadsonia fulvescens var. elongata DSM 6958]
MKSLIVVLSGLLTCFASVYAVEAPVVMFSYREIPAIVNQMPNDYELETHHQTPSEFNLFTRKLVSSCPSDAYIIIDQPGVSLDDFYPMENGILAEDDSLWTHTRKHMAFSGTVYTGSVQLNSGSETDELHLDSLTNSLIKQCYCQIVDVDLTRDDGKPFDKYIDTRCRIIRVKFDPLPTTSFSRLVTLTANDEMINKIMGFIPSPFITTIYTSSSPTEPKSHHTDPIFQDILIEKKDPRHRKQWENHIGIVERRQKEQAQYHKRPSPKDGLPQFQKELKPPHKEVGWARARKYAEKVNTKFVWQWESDTSQIDPNEVLLISNESLVALIASLIAGGLSILCLKFSFGLVRGEKQSKLEQDKLNPSVKKSDNKKNEKESEKPSVTSRESK